MDGIGHVITLGAAILAGTAAMVSFLQSTGTSKISSLYWYYLPGLLMPFGALTLMMALRVRRGRHLKPHFSNQTRVAARWTLTIGIGIAVGIFFVGRVGALPGQKVERAPVYAASDARPYAWETKSGKGIIVSINVDHVIFPDNYPSGLELHLSLRQELRENWQIVKATLIRATPGEAEKELELVEQYSKAKQPADLIAPYDAPLDEKQTYRVDVYLVAVAERSDKQVKDSIKAIMDGSGIKVVGSISR